jgi:hypothetical protein
MHKKYIKGKIQSIVPITDKPAKRQISKNKRLQRYKKKQIPNNRGKATKPTN